MRREKLCRILGYAMPFAVVGGGLYIASVGLIGVIRALDKAGVPNEIAAAVFGSVVLIILGTGLAAGFAGDMLGVLAQIARLIRGRRVEEKGEAV